MASTATLPENIDLLAETPTRIANGERCDSCASRAYWEVGFESSPLDFCNHHYNRFIQKFSDKPVTRIDWEDGFFGAVDYSKKSDSAFA